MTNGIEMTPPPSFSTPPQIPSNTTSEILPITTTVIAATTPENTPFAYHAFTSTNPNPTISPAFVEANYEILESLLRERRRQIRNEDLRTELEYFSEDYDEEREMKPRPEPRREATPTPRLRSLGVQKQRERVMGFEDASNREGNMSFHIPTRLVPTPVNPYSQPPVNLVHRQAPNFLFQTQMGNPPAGGASTYQGWSFGQDGMSDFDIPVVFSLIIALLRNKVSKLGAGVAFEL
ncbi:hypothetical protein Tco_0005581 [Tanacetum coccineum]